MTNKRFFYFTYSFTSNNHTGEGSLSLVSNVAFPSQKEIKQAAVDILKDIYSEPECNFSIVVLNWIELSEDDYSKWIA